MKILWIEDFGGRRGSGKLVIEVFGHFFNDTDLMKKYDEDNPDVAAQLADLFKRHTSHELYLCQSYLEWKTVDGHEHEGFDVAIIDLNLDSYATPDEEKPAGLQKRGFDSRAGFHIYHQLTKRGLSSDDIAFFTGESSTVKEFLRSCDEILLDKPIHVFEKNPREFKALREWLDEKAREKAAMGIRILLVDDEEETLKALASTLHDHSYHVSTARNGKQALIEVRDNEFDIVITDLATPILGGLDFIECLPKRNPPTRVIVISSLGVTTDDAVRALNLNVFAWIEKGSMYSVRKLLNSVEKAAWEKTKSQRVRKLRVFLSYASEDRNAANTIASKLSRAGFDPWLDKEKLYPGHDWRQEILTAMKSTDVVVICLSRQSISKTGFVQKEIRYALEIADERPPGMLFLIPLRLEPCEIPEQLKRWHSADIFEREEDFERLLSTLRTRADTLGLLEA
jgi:DNA-binding response OmpR family regulator